MDNASASSSENDEKNFDLYETESDCSSSDDPDYEVEDEYASDDSRYQSENEECDE